MAPSTAPTAVAAAAGAVVSRDGGIRSGAPSGYGRWPERWKRSMSMSGGIQLGN